MDINLLLKACAGEYSALVAKIDLEPIGSAKVMPPIYLAGPKSTERAQWIERRVVEGQSVKCAILDSTQSQANRFEEALQIAVESGELKLPLLQVGFPNHEPITSLTAPHRAYDAWLRHTKLDSVPFRDSNVGKAIAAAQPKTATGLLQYAPTVLLFGGWDSHVNTKTRFPRAISAEIVAIDIEEGRRAASRIDPINLRTKLQQTSEGGYRPGNDKAASEAGLASVAPHIETDHGGVTAKRIEQTIAISFAQLLRLRFPVNGEYSAERDASGRAVVAALGLFAVSRALASGYALRSGCWLRPIKAPEWRLLGPTPASDKAIQIEDARAILAEARRVAAGMGLVVDDSVYDLEPDPGLVEAVQMSSGETAEER